MTGPCYFHQVSIIEANFCCVQDAHITSPFVITLQLFIHQTNIEYAFHLITIRISSGNYLPESLTNRAPALEFEAGAVVSILSKL